MGEAAPLLAKRQSSRRRIVAAACTLLLCGLALVAGRRPRGGARGIVAVDAPVPVGADASALASAARFCLAQVAVGDAEIAASRPSFLSKATYAARHGYGFLWYEFADAEGFDAACPAIAHLARKSDPRAGAALCGLRAALDAGCEWTLVVDPRARVETPGVAIAALLGRGRWTADAAWIVLDDAGEDALTPVRSDPRTDCGAPDDFATRVDAAAFLARDSAFARDFSAKVLAVAGERDFLDSAACRDVAARRGNGTRAAVGDALDRSLACLNRIYYWTRPEVSTCLRSGPGHVYLDDANRPRPRSSPPFLSLPAGR